MNNVTRPCSVEQPRLELGQIVATQGVLENCTNVHMRKCLVRHLTGDWGCVCDEDRQANDAELSNGGRVLSAYPIDPEKPSRGFGENTLWIITEGDRSATTFLLPDEY